MTAESAPARPRETEIKLQKPENYYWLWLLYGRTACPAVPVAVGLTSPAAATKLLTIE